MKQIDFGSDKIGKNILETALPMLLAQICNLLYNIVDRVYIGRIPHVGTAALGGVGLCFPVITIILAFTNLYSGGGSPLFAMARGENQPRKAEEILSLTGMLEVGTGILLMAGLEAAAPLLLRLFGASDTALSYALPYLRIYLLGTAFSMAATGLNPFINAEGFPVMGMMSVIVGAVLNLILDPLLIFGPGPLPAMGIRGAAVATVLSQIVSFLVVVIFLSRGRGEHPIRLKMIPGKHSSGRAGEVWQDIRKITGLGLASFIMQITNSLVQMAANAVLSRTGGDIYLSVMTIVSSVRQMLEVPVLALTEGASPILSFNYGAGNERNVKKSVQAMTWMALSYTLAAWILVILFPKSLIRIFTPDKTILKDAVPALHMYFFAFIFMALQYSGQTVFKALGLKNQAIFFSLLRKAVIVVPLTFLLPLTFHMGTNGVFLAEPVSNVIGGSACFLTMFLTVRKILGKMQRDSTVDNTTETITK